MSSHRLTSLALVAAALLTSSIASAQSVTVSFGAGKLYDQNGVVAPSGSLVLLLADTTQNGFSNLLEGGLLATGSFLNGDDQILGRAFTDAGGSAARQLDPIFFGTAPFASVTTGDRLAVAWFPTLNADSLSLTAGTHYGFFSSLSSTQDGNPWMIPAGGSTIAINFRTIAELGLHAESEGYATATVTAVPEPATYAGLAGIAVLAVAGFRRRRR